MKKLNIITHIIPLILFIQCTSFSKVSKNTIDGHEKGYKSVINEEVNFKSLTFGDFEFAFNNKDYNKINLNKNKFDNILFYAKTKSPEYEYFVLCNPKEKSYNETEYIIKDTLINENKFVLIISKNAPKSDIEFISKNFYYYKD